MPVIIKNGKTYGDRSVTLTQAEYNALSEVDKNNGTVYYIYDVNTLVQGDEVEVGGGTVEDLAGSVATFETSPTTAVHAVGEYILYNAQLYKVISAIAVGETLTVGSNIEATSVGNELVPQVTEENTGITYTICGSMRRMDFAWAEWSAIKTFYNALPSADKLKVGNVVNTVFKANNTFGSPNLGYVGIDYQQGIYAEYISGTSVATMPDNYKLRGFITWFI